MDKPFIQRFSNTAAQLHKIRACLQIPHFKPESPLYLKLFPSYTAAAAASVVAAPAFAPQVSAIVPDGHCRQH